MKNKDLGMAEKRFPATLTNLWTENTRRIYEQYP